MEEADIFLEIKETKEQVMTIYEKMKDIVICDRDIFAGIYSNTIGFREDNL